MNKKFNTTIAPVWTTKGGNFASITLGEEAFDALQTVEPGGKFLVKLIPEEKRKNEKSPHGYLEYVSKEDVDAFQKAREKDEEQV